MSPRPLDPELERRLALLEDPHGSDGALGDLPWRDVALCAAGIVVMSVLLLMWGYPR